MGTRVAQSTQWAPPLGARLAPGRAEEVHGAALSQRAAGQLAAGQIAGAAESLLEVERELSANHGPTHYFVRQAQVRLWHPRARSCPC